MNGGDIRQKVLSRLRFRTAAMLVISLGLVLIVAAALIVLRTSSVMDDQRESQAHQFAQVVADLAQACGESGSIDNLERFRRNVADHELVEDIHVIRGPATAEDFGQREGAEPSDSVEEQALKDGRTLRIADPQAHILRLVYPTLAEESCVMTCHESAEVGDVLGAASITVSTEETDLASTSLKRIVIAVLLISGVFEIALVIGLLARRNTGKGQILTEEVNRQLVAYA